MAHLRRTRRTSVTASLWKRRASCTRVQAEATRDSTSWPSGGRPQVCHGDGGQGEVEGLGEVVLGELPLLPVLGGRLEGPGRGVGEEEGRGPVEQAAVGELDGSLGPADEARVEGRERAAEPHVEAVEAGRGVGEVPGDEHEDEEDREDPGEDLAHRAPPRRKRFQRPCGSQ